MITELNSSIALMKSKTYTAYLKVIFLNYHQLTTCIPKQWKDQLKIEEIQYRAPDYLFEKIVPQLKTCRFVYNKILEKKTNTQINQENK